jgi:hypothetical protein
MRSPRSRRPNRIERGSANSAYARRAHNPAWVVVPDDQGGCVRQESDLKDLARLNGYPVDGAATHFVVGDHTVLHGEAKEAEYFRRFVLKERKERGGGGTWIGDQDAVNRNWQALRVFGNGVTDDQFSKAYRSGWHGRSSERERL